MSSSAPDPNRNARAAALYKALFASACAAGLIAAEVGDHAKDRTLGTTPEEMLERCKQKFEGVPGAWPVCVKESEGSFERAAMAHGALRIISIAGLAFSGLSLISGLRRRKEDEDKDPPAPRGMA